MPVYLISGKLGSGKSLACVGRIRDAVREGKRVATNLDLNLDKLFKSHAGRPVRSDGLSAWRQPVDVIRVPDKPRVVDLEAIGIGNASYDESRNGLLVLDELGSWLNAREWADKSRQGVIDWLIHSRKKGWDVYLIVQDLSMIDKQVRAALVEYLVICRRFDRMRIPLFGRLLSFITAGFVKGYMPKMHFGIVRYGVSPDAVVADRWLYIGTDLYAGYDTRQVFVNSEDDASFTYLPPWHTTGRYLRPVSSLFQRFLDAFLPVALPRAAAVKPKHPAIQRLMLLPKDERMAHARRLLLRSDGVMVSPVRKPAW